MCRTCVPRCARRRSRRPSSREREACEEMSVCRRVVMVWSWVCSVEREARIEARVEAL